MLWTKSNSINLGSLLCVVVLSACAQVAPVSPNPSAAQAAEPAAQTSDTDEA
jgi:hypothetical protein